MDIARATGALALLSHNRTNFTRSTPAHFPGPQYIQSEAFATAGFAARAQRRGATSTLRSVCVHRENRSQAAS